MINLQIQMLAYLYLQVYHEIPRIVAFYKRDKLSPLQNGTNCRLGRILVFFWNLGRIVAWDELSLNLY